MEFKNRFELAEWLGSLLYNELGDKVDMVHNEENESTGRADVMIEFHNGDTAKLSVSMTDENVEAK